jgi:hypothetical protein
MRATATLAAALLTLTACGGADDEETKIDLAVASCPGGGTMTGDDGHSLILEMDGPRYQDQLVCLVQELKVPTHVMSQMAHTTSVQGQLSAQWDEFDARWTFDADNGLNMTITEDS